MHSATARVLVHSGPRLFDVDRDKILQTRCSAASPLQPSIRDESLKTGSSDVFLYGAWEAAGATREEVAHLARSMPAQWYAMFTGGEPFLRTGMPELMAPLYDCGAANLHLSRPTAPITMNAKRSTTDCRSRTKSEGHHRHLHRWPRRGAHRIRKGRMTLMTVSTVRALLN